MKINFSQTTKLIFISSLMILCALGCDKCEKKNGITWSEIQDWTVADIDPLLESGNITIRYDQEEEKWVFVYFDYIADDTTIIGPFAWHYPLPDQREYFPFDPDDPDDDRWVFEYNCSGGCCVQVFGLINGKFTLIKEHLIQPWSCDKVLVDTINKKKYIISSNFRDSYSVFTLNIDTGDSLSLYKDSLFKDLEIVNGRIILVIEKNDTCLIKVLHNGQIESEFKLPGELAIAKDDRSRHKIMVTKYLGDTRSIVLIVEDQGPSFGPVNPAPGVMVDLQLHKINNQTAFVVTTYDPQSDASHITILRQNGQLLKYHTMRGKFHSAKKESGADKKVFLTTDPGDHQGDGVTNFLKINLIDGEVIPLSRNSVPGRPGADSPSLNSDGSFDVNVTDASGNDSNWHITEQ